MKKYYIERLYGGKYNFNIWVWEEGENKYFGIANFFYQDALCGTQWNVFNKEQCLNYPTDEIKDEIETPLKPISSKKVQQLLKLETAQQVLDFILSEPLIKK